jgi:DNA invertase Pin-like site-specific DNA recombinase
MHYAYLRVSSHKQSVDNQRFEILKYCDTKNIQIDRWIEETVSGTKKVNLRKIGEFLPKMEKGDVLIITEISRLGRNLMEVMSILHDCMQNESMVYSIKENYELGNNINSKVLAFAFGLSAEIERNLISQRTKEALARIKSEGKKLGRPKGSLSKHTKLSGKEDIILDLMNKKISVSAIARILGVHRLTVDSYVKSRKLE